MKKINTKRKVAEEIFGVSDRTLLTWIKNGVPGYRVNEVDSKLIAREYRLGIKDDKTPFARRCDLVKKGPAERLKGLFPELWGEKK